MINNYNFLYKMQDSVVFCVKLVPNSSVSKIVDYTEDYVRIKISAPPVDNRANKELIAFCSKIFDVNKSKIEIISGEKSKVKKILIKNENLDILSQKILFMLDSLESDAKK